VQTWKKAVSCCCIWIKVGLPMEKTLFVISRSPGEDALVPGTSGKNGELYRAFEEKVIGAMAGDAVNVLVIPHVYYLYSEHNAVARLKDYEGDIVLASWMHERAAWWTLRWLGVERDMAGGEEVADSDKRKIMCIMNLDSYDNVDECISHCRELISVSIDAEGEVETISESAGYRWHPIVDYARCVGCRQCYEFCLFGVYTIRKGTVFVANPDKCKPGCPACARVCSRGAIMFPHYEGSDVIAGAPVDENADENDSQNKPVVKNDGLDDLIDALDDMDS